MQAAVLNWTERHSERKTVTPRQQLPALVVFGNSKLNVKIGRLFNNNMFILTAELIRIQSALNANIFNRRGERLGGSTRQVRVPSITFLMQDVSGEM